MKDPRSLWEARYAEGDANTLTSKYDPWIDTWMDRPEITGGETVLDIGCGRGRDSQYMTGLGYNVISIDLAREALRECRRLAPKAAQLQVDLRSGLPFRDGAFRVIVANLTLHYFSWQLTESIVEEVKRCLKAEGTLLARLNSTGDVNHGAVGHEEIEPGLFLISGEQKRFFNRASIQMLFSTGWNIHRIQEMAVDIYPETKVLWEIVLERAKG